MLEVQEFKGSQSRSLLMNKKLFVSSFSSTHVHFGGKASNYGSKVFLILMIHASNIVRHSHNARLIQFKTHGQICIQTVTSHMSFRAISYK